jgi:fatty acid amide hydrolase
MWTDDGNFPASPALRRAVEESAAALRQLGAHVEPFHPPDIPHAVDLFFQLTSADGGADVLRILGDSPRDWRVRRMLLLCRTPRPVRRALAALLQSIGQPRTARLLRNLGRCTTDVYWQRSFKRAEYAERFFAAWNRARLDAVICPPHALPALRHGATADLTVAASNCFWANVLGVPAGVVPATRVQLGEESDRQVVRDRVDLAARRVEQDSAGLPVGVQVAAAPWREDVVLAVMGALETHFRSIDTFPRTPISPAAI